MTGTVTLRAKLRVPVLPNYLEVEGVRASSLDQAIAAGDSFRVDVGSLDDQAIDDFCAAWVLAFVRHAKARRAKLEKSDEPKA